MENNSKLKIQWLQLIRRAIKEEGRVQSKIMFQQILQVMPKELKNDLVEAYFERFGVLPPSEQ